MVPEFAWQIASATDPHTLEDRLSPAAQRYLSSKSADWRHRFIDGIRQRLHAAGSPQAISATGERPLIAFIEPHLVGSGPHGRINITDLDDLPSPPDHVLRDLFGLSPAEARLARLLAKGDSLEEAAAVLDIKMTTARTQLAAVFGKTGTRRQAKLVAVLSRLAHVSC